MDKNKRARARTPRPRRGRDGQATRDGLLAAATQHFAARGYDGVSEEQIALRAGVTTALINYHFGGKHNLYVTIMTSTFSEIVDRVEHVAASNRPAPEQLREFVALVDSTRRRVRRGRRSRRTWRS